jgi:hypothetical protein
MKEDLNEEIQCTTCNCSITRGQQIQQDERFCENCWEPVEDERRYIYKCSWFETKKHKISHTDMYFENAEDTKWIFETQDWFLDLVRVEYIMVHSSRNEYKSAVNNSNKK